MIDFHTHILPNMDDGSTSVTESNLILESLKTQNVKLVCLTSHFYPSHESIDDYLIRRNKAFELLNYKGDIELRLGAEVRYYRGISQSDNIESLCIEKTNILLLELPFNGELNDSIFKEVIALNNNRNVIVMLAHIERYDIDESMIRILRNNGILIQSNCEFILGSLFNHIGLNWLKKGYIDVLGSDCHNLQDRKPEIEKTMIYIEKKLGEDFIVTYNSKCSKIMGI